MIIGIDVGGTTIKFGVVNSEGKILETERHDTLENTVTPEKFIDLLIKVSSKYADAYEIEGIGIGLPGQLSIDRKTLVEASNLGTLNGTDIHTPLKKHFPNFIIRLENDANCAALGELYFGGHNLDNFIMIALGTGVGGGIVINRKLFIGAKGNAGEVGMIPVGDGEYLENYVGQRHIVKYVKEELAKSENASSSLNSLDEITVEAVYNAAKAGDDFSNKVFQRVGTLIGEAILAMVHLYDVSQVIIGGGVGKSFDLIQAPMEAKLKSMLSPYYLNDLKLLPAGNLADTGLIGSASLVLNELETC